MKKIVLSISLLTLLVASCSKDDSSDNGSQGNQELANAQNATEENDIPLSVLESGISISGAEKIEGAAPAVNSDLTFSVTSGSEAFQGSGLDIQVDGGENIAGAYIQLKDTEGNASASYFDVPVTAFGSGASSRKNLNTHRSVNFVSQDFDFEQNQTININVAFDNIPAGQFCYDICLYDADNNVYVVQEVCVEVEAWGGNADIVGSWAFNRFEGEQQGGFIELITCDSEGEVSYDYDDLESEEEWIFTLNEDGSYSEIYTGTFTSVDYEETQATCTLVLENSVEFSNGYSGNWAFNESDNTLTVIDFSSQDFINDTTEEFPEGELYFEGVSANVVNGELRLEDEDGDVFVFTRR